MGNIKYRDENGEWKVASSSNASGIAVSSPQLKEGGIQPTSVEDVLLKHDASVEQLKRNVSWLAKNGGGGGGGGTGSGPGSSIVEATTKILVNNLATGSTVLLDDNGLVINFSEMSVQATANWRVNVSIGNVIIASGSVSFTSNIMRIATSIILPRLINHSGILTINATYTDDVNSIYGSAIWTGTILEATVNIATEDISIDLNDDGLPSEDRSIVYNYSTGIIGGYNLKIEALLNGAVVNTVNRDLNVVSTEDSTYAIDIKEVITNPNPGSYTIRTTLSNKEMPSITKTIVSSINYRSKNLIIVSTALSEDINKPVEVSISGSLNLSWYCVAQGVVGIDYNYAIKGQVIKTGSAVIETVVNDFIPLNGKDWAVVGTVVPVVVTATAGDKKTTKTYYFKISEAIGDFIKHSSDTIGYTILDFKAKDFDNGDIDFEVANNDYLIGGLKTPISARMKMVNSSNLVGIKSTSTTTPSLRLSNGAYMQIDNFNYGGNVRTLNQILETQYYRFSMNICFKADYHPDDKRTIFSIASVDNNTGNPQNAIEIDVHNVYINGKSVLDLTDNVTNDIAITFTYITNPYTDNEGNLTTLPRWVCKVYLDGVLSAVEIFTSQPTFENTIYLAGKKYSTNTDEGDWLCDCNIYSFSLYNKTLNDEDILVNYINNKVLQTYVDGLFDFSIISPELRKSFCELNTDNTIKNSIYNRASDSYNLNMILNANQELDNDALNSYASVIGIPIVLIDVSNIEAWSFANFILQQSAGNVSLSPAVGQKVQYYDPNGTNRQVLTINNCTIELQGTSTLADAVKNLNLSLPADPENSTIFIPKETWLPEDTYTFKADVVDSSHSNNASIGKFINEVIDEFFPYAPEAKKNIENSEYIAKQQPTATLKHTVEGFPVLLLMKFYVAKPGDISITPLGIYNFNLGRNAYRNLGFKRLDSIHDSTGSLINVESFPHLTERAVVHETESNANWIEVKDTYSVPDLQKIEGNELPANFDSSSGDFWQSSNSILNLLYEVRYGSRPNPADYDNFKNLVAYIMQLPIEAPFKIIDRTGNMNVAQISGDYDSYEYVNGAYVKGNVANSMILDTNQFVEPPFSPESFYKYFVIANLFGLADNFGKNSTYRSWNNGTYYIGFYDMDTALGGDNQGELTIKTDMWNKFFANDIPDGKRYGWLTESYADESNNPKVLGGGGISARANKIWISIDTETARNVFQMNNFGSQYSYQYEQLRKYLHSKAVAAGYTNFVDFFIKEYYSKQCGDCGPLLFNLDYRLKYLLQFDNNTYENISFASKLHGRKAAYTRNWLDNRITFLDSWFATKRLTQQYGVPNDYDSKADIKTYNTPESIPVVFNTPLIFNFKVGDASKSYYYAPANTKVYIDAGFNNSGSVLTGGVNNSPQLLSIGDEETPLSKMEINLMNNANNANALNEQGYPSFISLDLTNSNKLSPSFLLDSFKPAGAGISELREISFKNASCVNESDSFELSLYDELSGGQQNSKFEKLRKIDISGSKCIKDIKIPAIPLRELNIVGSKLINLQFINQNYIDYVDITNCDVINTIKIHNCAEYSKFEISDHNNIKEISLFNLPKLKYVNINNCPNLTKITIQGCSACESIVINDCSGLTGINDSSNFLNIVSNTALKTIDVKSCTNLQNINISDSNQANITTLNISYTKVNRITGDGAITTINSKNQLDLSAFVNLVDFNCVSNTSVIQIQFANDQNHPIPLKYSFQRCNVLERIYGHVILTSNLENTDGNGQFMNCSNFSIHERGANALGPTTWKNKALRDANHRIKTPWEVISGIADDSASETSYNGVTWAQSFIGGKTVTNFSMTSNYSLNQTFANTYLTTFDIYYILFVAALQHTAGDNMYRTFYNIKHNKDKTHLPLFVWYYNEDTNTYYDNAPRRFTFFKCSFITELNRTFESTTYRYSDGTDWYRDTNGNYGSNIYGVDYTFIMGPSSTVNADKTVTINKDNGVYSPLVNCINLFVLQPQVGSKYVLRRKTGDYKIGNISDFTLLVVPNEYDYRIRKNYNNNLNPTNTNILKAQGDFTDFFKNLTALRQFERIGSAHQRLNLSTIKFPISIQRVHKFPNTVVNATGTCDLEVMFEGCNPIRIGEIFRCSTNTNYGPQAKMIIRSTTTSKFTNLVSLGGTHGEYDSYNTQWGFSGMDKSIEGDTFPYDIFKNNTKLKTCIGFFADCKKGEIENCILPNTLFANNPAIVNVHHLFYNFQIPYTLKGDGFAKCVNLNNVYGIFQYPTSINNYPVLTGEIPYHLFYHGTTAASKTIQGVTQAVYDEIVAACTVDGTTDFTTDAALAIIRPKLISYTNRYSTPITQLATMNYAFYGNIYLSKYTGDDKGITKEINPNYVGPNIKYIWNATTKSFSPVTTEQTYEYIDWGYNGIPTTKENGVYYYDTATPNVLTNPCNPEKNYLNYCAPGDLFRYLNPNTTNVSHIFELCGNDILTQGLSPNNTNINDWYNFGITGRICPYLLKPVPKLTNADALFKYCRKLSSFEINGTVYQIPPDFFSYTRDVNSLVETFEGLGIDYNTNLAVFDNINATADIRKIFAVCVYHKSHDNQNTTNISGVFNNIKISYATGAFCNNDIVLNTNNKNTATTKLNWSIGRDQDNVIFGTNFSSSKYANKGNASYVYYNRPYSVDRALDTVIADKNNNYES